jgi:DNA adenine methylase
VPTSGIDQVDLIRRANKSLSSVPRSFLRWAGSKRSLLPQIVPYIPPEYGTYFEPFLGGGSLYFAACPAPARLSDVQPELIETYLAVRDHAQEIIDRISRWDVDSATYYKVRAERSGSGVDRAARFVYLNRTCWNGLYRVNSSGEFNVPFGRPNTKAIVDAENLLACSQVLSSPDVQLDVAGFQEATITAARGDFVFFDPPYVTGHNNNGFVDYNRRLFAWRDQVALADVAKALVAGGTHVIVANANHSDVIALYGADFVLVELRRNSSLAASTKFRRPVTEALLVSRSDR